MGDRRKLKNNENRIRSKISISKIRAHFLICYLALMIFRIMKQKMEEIGEHFTAHEIITTLRKYEVIDMESFYIEAMEGKATKTLEKNVWINRINISDV